MGDLGGWWGCGGVNSIHIDNSTDIAIGNGDRPGNRPATRPAIDDRVPGAERPKPEEAGAPQSGNRLSRDSVQAQCLA